MTSDVYTENMGDFGARELNMLKDILVEWLEGKGLPVNFDTTGIKPAMNRNSGYVFLVNEEYQCAMINDESGELELHHSTPYNGHEGFLKELVAERKPDEYSGDDLEYLVDAIEAENLAEEFIPAEWLKVLAEKAK